MEHGFYFRELKTNGVEAKGLGKILNKVETPVGLADLYQKNAVLLKYGDGYNIIIVDNSVVGGAEPVLMGSEPFCLVECLFEHPVSEEEARRVYKKLH